MACLLFPLPGDLQAALFQTPSQVHTQEQSSWNTLDQGLEDWLKLHSRHSAQRLRSWEVLKADFPFPPRLDVLDLYVHLYNLNHMTKKEKEQYFASFAKFVSSPVLRRDAAGDAMALPLAEGLSHLPSRSDRALLKAALAQRPGLERLWQEWQKEMTAEPVWMCSTEQIKQRHKRQNQSSKVKGKKSLRELTAQRVGSGRCTYASKQIKKSLTGLRLQRGTDRHQEMFADILASVRLVERCFRKRGVKRRVAVWRGFVPYLKRAYGDRGEIAALQRMGGIYWNKNYNDEAIALLDGYVRRNVEKGTGRLRSGQVVQELGDLLYLLAQVEYQQGLVKQAQVRLVEVAEHFSGSESYQDSMKFHTVIKASEADWQGVIDVTSRLIAFQGAKPLRERHASYLGFALFWHGRAWFEMGRKSQALAAWYRVSREFYSTYYGAMGHYLLEKKGGQLFALEPRRGRPFRKDSVFTMLDRKEEVSMQRLQVFLRLGAWKKAECSYDQIDFREGSPRHQLARTMLNLALGRWVAAIRSYGTLHREFRDVLPYGSEKMLFPFKYENLVQTFSGKLGLEAELVFGLIRQESAFHASARSPVGARGLMQLMPMTARAEAKKLPRHYSSKSEKRRINARLKSLKALYDPKLNLKLGVFHLHNLLNLYQNPVFALTSYNASPTATRKWRASIPSDDMMLFIERIPYKETRAYVKLVMRNYFYYKRWYGPAGIPLPMLDEILLPALKKPVMRFPQLSRSSPFPIFQ